MEHTNQYITETLEKNYMPYAMSVIISRAIPEIDGLKPSHRKLLFTMYKMGLLNGGRTKSANVVGQTMKLNPHGDAAIYETMVRLTEGNSALLHPYVDSKGNFGKQYSRDMAYAAARYTEVKLASICREIFEDIDKDTVDFIDNYDGTMQEPVLLPVKYPAVLTNSNQGIAVGMASNICSFNLKEVCLATVHYLKNPRCDVAKYLLAPDFSTGGEILYDEQEMREIYETGKGSIKVRAKYKYDKKNNCIEITEIPYTTTIEAVIDKIIELIKANKLKEVSDVRDETDLSGLKITIDLKRGTDPEKVMAKLYKTTSLMDSFGCNFNILINSSPMVLGVKDILEYWSKFRIECIKRKTAFDINKKSEKLHLLEGLEKILLDIDKAIKIIRETEFEADVLPNLMDGFNIDKVQAEFIAEIKLRNLNREYILKRTQDIDQLIDEIAMLKAIYNSEEKIKEIIIEELKEISKKYGKERKSQLITADEVVEYQPKEEIEDYAVTVFATKEGYLKKITPASLRASNVHKLKEGDEIDFEVETTNLAEIIAFTNMQNAYKIKAHEIADTKASSLGEYLPSLLKMEEGELVVGVAVTTDFKEQMLFCYENGKMTKVPLVKYETKQNRKKLTNALSDVAPVVAVITLKEETDIVAVSSIGKVVAFNTALVSLKSTRDSQGVTVMTLKKGATLSRVVTAEQFGIDEAKYYRIRKIPSAGCFVKEEQTSLF